MEMYAYDIEVFRNYAIFIFIDVNDYFTIRAELDNASAIEFEQEIVKVKKHVFIIGLGSNDISQLVAFVNREIILASFNGLDYDNVIVNYCIAKINYWKSTEYTNDQLYKMSKKIIANRNASIYNDESINVYKRMRTLYKTIDVQKVFGLNKVLKSLKQTLINLKWFNIEDYEMPAITEEEHQYYDPNELYAIDIGLFEDWDRYVMSYHIAGLATYCLNDSLGVGEIIYQKTKDIVLRFDISEEYGVNVLSSSESNIADKLFGKFYCEAAGMDMGVYLKGRTERDFVYITECLPDNIRFTSPEFIKLHNELKRTVIRETKGELEFKVTFDGITYDVKTGGLHSRDIPGKFAPTDNTLLRDADVISYYPISVWNNQIAPAHLDKEIFTTTTKVIVDDRVHAKKTGDKVRNKTLKIVINSGVFGKMGFEDSPVYDLAAMVSVTIGDQLYLLMLIERIVSVGCKVISANTDGIVTIIPKDKEQEYYRVCNEWCKELSFELEYTNYELYIRRDVNNYMAVEIGDDPVKERIKFKGSLNPNLYKEDLRKGYRSPIVATAVMNYYIYDIAIMDTIEQSNDIMDFCTTQKPNKKYQIELHNMLDGKHNITVLSKNIRFYISKARNKLSGILLKNDTTIDEGKPKKYIRMAAGRNVTVFNKRIDLDIADYKIDYGYYYTEAMKIIKAIESNSKLNKVIKKEYGQYKMGF